MLPYYLLVFVPIVFYFLNVKGLDKNKKPQRIISYFFIILLFLLVFRAPTLGRDLRNYNYIFVNDIEHEWGSIGDIFSEPAWFVLNKAIGFFTESFQWILVVTAFLTIIPLIYVYKKEIVYPVLTVSLFITMSTFVLLFSGLRQAIAISLGLIAYEFTKKRKLIPFILIVVLAFLFHKSAFMLLFMYPLYHVKVTKKWLWFIVPSVTLIFIFNKPIFGWLTAFISDFYIGGISETGAYTMLILFLIFCVFAFVIPDESKMDDSVLGMRNFLLLATAVQIFAPLNSLAMRMGYYYIIFIPLLIPKIVNCSSDRWKQIANISKYVMVVFFVCYFFIAAPRQNVLDTFPYHFFWENVV